MHIEPKFELGVDYDGSSDRHYQTNEVKIFNNDEVGRVFIPERGVFFKDSLVIRDYNTNRYLVSGIDYNTLATDIVATEKSGKDCRAIIELINPSIKGIVYDYRFLGGIHSTGFYALEQLLKMYPNGSEILMTIDDVLDKPDLFDPAYHTQHVRSLYGTDDVLVELERIRQGFIHRQEKILEDIYAAGKDSFDKLYQKLEDNHDRITTNINEVLRKISIQKDEYIFTANPNNPITYKEYGVWELVTDRILSAAPGTIVRGSGKSLGFGGGRPIQNCYIWRNIEGSTNIDMEVTLKTDKPVYNEGDKVTITVTRTVGTAIGAADSEWILEGHDEFDLNSAPRGVLTWSQSTAKVVLETRADKVNDGNKSYRFRLVSFPDKYVDFTVLDTSNSPEAIGDDGGIKKIHSVGFRRAVTRDITSVEEGATLTIYTRMLGLYSGKVWIKWSDDATDLVEGVLPEHFDIISNSVVNTSISTHTITLKTNARKTGPKVLEFHVLLSPDEVVVDGVTPKARIVVWDTVKVPRANIVFRAKSGEYVQSIPEGDEFDIIIKSNDLIGLGQCTVNYITNKNRTEFSGLVNGVTATTSNQGVIVIPVKLTAAEITRWEEEYLLVQLVYASTVIAEGNISILDTSRNPSIMSGFSNSTAILSSITKLTTINEGGDFYYTLHVDDEVYPAKNIQVDLLERWEGDGGVETRVRSPKKMQNVILGKAEPSMDIDVIKGIYVNKHRTIHRWKLNAIADKAVRGNGVYQLAYRITGTEQWSPFSNITIVDTSRPTLNATWSSSPTTLTPITSVNEMNTAGGDNRCWLWIDVDGVGNTLGNFQLRVSGTATMADLVTTFPQDIDIASGSNRRVVEVVIKADGIPDGDKRLVITAIHPTFGNLFTTGIDIIDNSITSRMSFTGNSNGIMARSLPRPNLETEPLVMNLEFEPIGVSSNIYLELQHLDGPNKMVLASGPVLKIDANVDSYPVIIEDPTLIPHDGGTHRYEVKAIRKLYNGKPITPEVIETISFSNNNVIPKIVNHFWTTIDHKPVTELMEYGEYLLNLEVVNPVNNTNIIIGNTTNQANDDGVFIGNDRVSIDHNYKVGVRFTNINEPIDKLTIPILVDVGQNVNNSTASTLNIGVKVYHTGANSVLSLGDEYIGSITGRDEGSNYSVTVKVNDVDVVNEDYDELIQQNPEMVIGESYIVSSYYSLDEEGRQSITELDLMDKSSITGETFWLQIITKNVPDGTVLSISHPALIGVDPDLFVGGPNTPTDKLIAVVSNNKAVLKYTLA